MTAIVHTVKTAFLVCALALPPAKLPEYKLLTQDYYSDYALYRREIEKSYPYLTVFFAHPSVNLRAEWNDELRKTRYRIGNPPLRVWFIRRRYQESA